jgi:hypothetical protein
MLLDSILSYPLFQKDIRNFIDLKYYRTQISLYIKLLFIQSLLELYFLNYRTLLEVFHIILEATTMNPSCK